MMLSQLLDFSKKCHYYEKSLFYGIFIRLHVFCDWSNIDNLKANYNLCCLVGRADHARSVNIYVYLKIEIRE